MHPRVALLVETSGGYGRKVLAGVSQYSRVNGPWSFYVLPRGHEQSLPDMKVWRGTGLIARIETKKIADAIAAAQPSVPDSACRQKDYLRFGGNPAKSASH